jgi:4-alpha-glucanotransferase
VIGEDLGTVEDEVQSELADRNVAGCRVVWFTDGDEDEWPAATLGSVTTHDLPTVAGIWTGADGAARRRLGIADEDSQRSFLQRLQTRAPHADSVREVITAVHDRLARSGSSVVLASLDDALGLVEPPNVPGTIDEWPNWRIGLPVPLEVIQRDSAALELAHTMNVGRAAPVAAPVDEPTR